MMRAMLSTWLSDSKVRGGSPKRSVKGSRADAEDELLEEPEMELEPEPEPEPEPEKEELEPITEEIVGTLTDALEYTGADACCEDTNT